MKEYFRAIILYVGTFLSACYFTIIFAVHDVLSYFFPKINFIDTIKFCYSNIMLFILQLSGFKIYHKGQITKSRKLWISNHRSELDGVVIQAYLCCKGNETATVGKKSIKYWPIFGYIGTCIKNIFIVRKKEKAQDILIKAAISSMESNYSILIFPEGTTMGPMTKIISDNYAQNNNIKPLRNVLIPKETGVNILKSNGKFNSIGDITIKYDGPIIPNGQNHSLLDLFKLFPSKIYLDINDDSKIEKLYDIFKNKDILLNTPYDHDSYKYDVGYDLLCLIPNLFMMGIFYYYLYNIPHLTIVTLLTLMVTSFMTILY